MSARKPEENPIILAIWARIFGFWTPGIVPQGARRDFLQVPGVNPSGAFTWTRISPKIMSQNLGEHFVDFGCFYTIIILGVPGGK